MTVVTGPNNSGKTNIIKALCGFKDLETFIEDNQEYKDIKISVFFDERKYNLEMNIGIRKGNWLIENHPNNLFLSNKVYQEIKS